MRGIGETYLATTELNGGNAISQNLYPNPFFTFNYSADSTPIEAQGFVAGQQQTVGSAKGPVTHNFTLESQYIRRSDRALIMGHLPKDFANVIFPVRVDSTVPNAAPYEITDTDITVANRNYILVYDDTYGPLAPTADASTAPADQSQVQVNTIETKLTYHENASGRATSYTKPYTFSGKGYGGAGAATSLGRMVFRGRVYDFGAEEALVEFPALDLVNVVELAVTGDVPTYQLQFLAAVPSGWTHPYRFLEVATAS